MEKLRDEMRRHIKDTLNYSLQLQPGERVLIMFDRQTQLSEMLLDAYQNATHDPMLIDFDKQGSQAFFDVLQTLKPNDLVILIQSTNFRLNDFRIRIELFKRGLKTIEHSHLVRMTELQWQIYVDALAYDPNYYRPLAHGLKARLDRAQTVRVLCKGTELIVTGGLEEAKLNIGDYTNMEHVGGTFPIGEVFTEAKDLTKMNGSLKIFAFAGDDHQVQMHEPFLVTVKDGILEAEPTAPRDFLQTLETIRAEEPVQVRELGFGLNRAMNKHRVVDDITTFERQYGMHMSLGLKHGVYKKPGLNPKHTRYHVDVFVDVEQILLDEEPMFLDGQFRINNPLTF